MYESLGRKNRRYRRSNDLLFGQPRPEGEKTLPQLNKEMPVFYLGRSINQGNIPSHEMMFMGGNKEIVAGFVDYAKYQNAVLSLDIGKEIRIEGSGSISLKVLECTRNKRKKNALSYKIRVKLEDSEEEYDDKGRALPRKYYEREIELYTLAELADEISI